MILSEYQFFTKHQLIGKTLSGGLFRVVRGVVQSGSCSFAIRGFVYISSFTRVFETFHILELQIFLQGYTRGRTIGKSVVLPQYLLSSFRFTTRKVFFLFAVFSFIVQSVSFNALYICLLPKIKWILPLYVSLLKKACKTEKQLIVSC